jgi:hypothetical protein
LVGEGSTALVQLGVAAAGCAELTADVVAPKGLVDGTLLAVGIAEGRADTLLRVGVTDGETDGDAGDVDALGEGERVLVAMGDAGRAGPMPTLTPLHAAGSRTS